jgi:hypothetical protein
MGILRDVYLFSGRSRTSWDCSLISSDRLIFSLFLWIHRKTQTMAITEAMAAIWVSAWKKA